MYALNIRVWMCTNTHCCVFLLICNEMTQYMNTNLPRKHDMKHISSGQQGHRKKQALLIQDSRQYFLYTEIIERGLTTSSTSRLYSHGSYSHRLGFWPQQPCTNKHYSSCRGRSLVKPAWRNEKLLTIHISPRKLIVHVEMSDTGWCC